MRMKRVYYMIREISYFWASFRSYDMKPEGNAYNNFFEKWFEKILGKKKEE